MTKKEYLGYESSFDFLDKPLDDETYQEWLLRCIALNLGKLSNIQDCMHDVLDDNLGMMSADVRMYTDGGQYGKQ